MYRGMWGRICHGACLEDRRQVEESLFSLNHVNSRLGGESLYPLTMSLHGKKEISLQPSQIENVGNWPVLTTRPVDSVNLDVRRKTALGPLLCADVNEWHPKIVFRL